jgi:hypothetical protein
MTLEPTKADPAVLLGFAGLVFAGFWVKERLGLES